MGLCAQCLFIHYKQKHEILCLEDTIRSVRSIIATMDETVSECLDKKHKLLQRMQKKINIFEQDEGDLMKHDTLARYKYQAEEDEEAGGGEDRRVGDRRRR